MKHLIRNLSRDGSRAAGGVHKVALPIAALTALVVGAAPAAASTLASPGEIRAQTLAIEDEDRAAFGIREVRWA